MNGLEFIRNRCNFSYQELGDKVGVSRQTTSYWAQGNRGISDKHKKKLSQFLGIDSEYFGEITEEQKQEIIDKPLFIYNKGDKEKYRFIPNNENEDVYACFMGEDVEMVDKIYEAAIKRKNTLLENIKNQIDKDKEYSCKLAHANEINRMCSDYESILKIFDHMNEQAFGIDGSYIDEIRAVISAMVMAYFSKDDSEVLERLKVDTMGLNYDPDFINGIAEQLKNHWEAKQRQCEGNVNEFFKALMDKQLNGDKTEKSMEEKIKDIEKWHKQDKNAAPFSIHQLNGVAVMETGVKY